MHFFKKSIGLMAVLCAIPGAYAATARPSVVTTAASRMPTMIIKTSGVTSVSTGSTTSTALLANSECIDAYSECIHGADACGENFEECTTKVLFHGKMPQCLGTLAQCSSSGVESLFGTSTISALASGEVKNTYGEVTDYTYPTNGSVLGQMITAAAISNQYDTSTCVRRVTSCLRKDSVCGDDFELCTTNKEFRKQRVFCDSTLARCQSEGVIELLGSSNRTATPTASSRIGEMIAEGAALAAVQSVNTCYKVVEQCFIGACAQNPYKCYENSSQALVDIVEAINNGTEITTEMVDMAINKSSISAYLKNSCLDTIGSNKYCYATFLGNGQMPTNAQLRDEDNQEEIFDLAYESRMNDAMRAKIADLVDKFDTKAKQKCTDTIKSCAMRVCGGGVGSACYAAVFNNSDKSINGATTYGEIKTGCEAIVNTDMYCKYSATNPNSTGAYSYTYMKDNAFNVLFPEYGNGSEIDPIGVVATLNSALATNYNDAAIAQMRKSCENVAKGCIKSMCGSEYTNCYRNRTDIISGSYNTNTGLDKSMNKMGGVLDNNVVIGLCLDTIKNASSCEEHLAIQTAKRKTNDQKTSGWGSNTTVRDAWLDANSTTAREQWSEEMVETGFCTPSDTKGGKCNANDLAPCDTVDEKGCVYDTKQKMRYMDYVLDNEAETLLQQVMVDIEKEAQATYNAKLTKEQNMCLAANNAGGILSSRDIGSTFMWAKLKMTSKVPAGYNVNGLKSTQFEASNDLYGSFCRVRVTLQSDDKKIQEAMRNKQWTTAYFAVGDAFTCGSWIPESDLEDLAKAVAEDAVADTRKAQDRVRTWTTILGALGGGAGGLALGESLRTGKTLGGLTTLGKEAKETKATSYKNSCANAAYEVEQAKTYTTAVTYARKVESAASELDITQEQLGGVKQARIALNEANSACDADTTCNVCTKCAGLLETLQAEVDTVKGLCSKADEKEIAENDPKTRGWITAVTSVALSGAGALLVNKATRDIQESELDAAQKAAYEEWMSKVGRHITCYIGGDEAGNYGDVITTSLE